jgi:hypothetical protein
VADALEALGAAVHAVRRLKGFHLTVRTCGGVHSAPTATHELDPSVLLEAVAVLIWCPPARTKADRSSCPRWLVAVGEAVRVAVWLGIQAACWYS